MGIRGFLRWPHLVMELKLLVELGNLLDTVEVGKEKDIDGEEQSIILLQLVDGLLTFAVAVVRGDDRLTAVDTWPPQLGQHEF